MSNFENPQININNLDTENSEPENNNKTAKENAYSTLTGEIMRMHDINIVVRLIQKFRISREDLLADERIRDAMRWWLRFSLVDYKDSSRFDAAIKIKQLSLVSKDDFDQIVLDCIKEDLGAKYIDNAIGVKSKLQIKTEKLRTPELYKIAYKRIMDEYFKVRRHEEEEDIDDDDWSNDDKFSELVTKFLTFFSFQNLNELFPETYRSFLNTLNDFPKEKIDAFRNIFDKSLSVQISLFKLKAQEGGAKKFEEMLQKFPFLLDAAIRNEHHGGRLFSAWTDFDETSREKISLLFKEKERILLENTNIDQDSVAFRKAMQQKLETYDRNPEIMEEMQKNGIETDMWMNYDVKDSFALGSEKEKPSLETLLEIPIKNVSERSVAYTEILKKILGNKDEKGLTLRQRIASISTENPEIEGLKKSLASMEERLKLETDPKKIEGMKRGIESHKKKLDTLPKSISLDKILDGSIDLLIKANESVKKAKDDLYLKQTFEAEKSQKFGELKKKLDQGCSSLAIRFNNLRQLVETSLEKLGVDGKNALENIGKDARELLEDISHDHEVVSSVLRSEDLREYFEIKKASLALWNRNPDIDLYLGNYSPCCISIEGGAGWDGSESAIADYLTDLSIHVLNLTNNETREPIMSAWLYIGKNKQGETALIIDNIEANEKQTAAHKKEIWEKVGAYVTELAQKIGVSKVLMGKENNDILPESPATNSKKYSKIGPVNGKPREKEGYYLESEDEESLWLIWKK